MPTRPLPDRPDLDHLKAQARDLLADCARGDPPACQRLREFHPRFAGHDDAGIAVARLSWSDALFAIAREYGFASWPRLKARVEARGSGETPLVDQIADPVLREAVVALDDGDEAALGRLLAEHPDLPRRRARFEGLNYFRAPALLAFIADNPTRNDSLPPNAVAIADRVIAAGTARADITESLELVASGSATREAGLQLALIDLLVAHGGDPAGALDAALVHAEFDAARRLLALGAPMALPAAAALGDLDGARMRLDAADGASRHRALAYAAQHGRVAVLALLLDAGEEPDRYNPPGAHAHSTPLHQAAWYGHAEAVRLLLAHGARTDLRDTLWNGTPADWARHAGRPGIAALIDGG